MIDSIYIDPSYLKDKINRQEQFVVDSNVPQDIEESPFKYLMQVLTDSTLNVRDSYTKPEFIYPNYPIKTESMVRMNDDLAFDLQASYKDVNSTLASMAMINADTEERYYYAGTKFLSPTFQKNYLKAKYSNQILVFDNFQNVEKNVLDKTFFVDRGLGFVTKPVNSIKYYTPTVALNSSPSRLIPQEGGYYPDLEDTEIELFLTLSSTSLINMIYAEMTFPGDQYIQEIAYIQFSVDGVKYVDVDAGLLAMINQSFGTIYDQNFFTGFIPITPTFARYVKIGVVQKLSSPRIEFGKLLLVGAEFNQDYQKVEIPVLNTVPYVVSGKTEMSGYAPWPFNYARGWLIFKEDGSINFSLDMSLNSDILGTYKQSSGSVFASNFFNYTSPIIFDYSVFIGL